MVPRSQTYESVTRMGAMASEGTNQVPEELLASRKQMYASFVRFCTWGIGAIAILLSGLALFLL